MFMQYHKTYYTMTSDRYNCNYGTVMIKQTSKTDIDTHYVAPAKTEDTTYLIFME